MSLSPTTVCLRRLTWPTLAELIDHWMAADFARMFKTQAAPAVTSTPHPTPPSSQRSAEQH